MLQHIRLGLISRRFLSLLQSLTITCTVPLAKPFTKLTPSARAISFTSDDFFLHEFHLQISDTNGKILVDMIRTLCLYWLLQCVRNGFFKVEVIGVSGCDLRVSQGDWRSLMLAPPRASFLRHGWLHHHFSICCPFVKTLSGLCNFGHSYWRAICPTEHFTGFGHFNMLVGFSYLGKLFFGKLSLTHMYLFFTMWWHLMLLHICTWRSMWVAFARFQEGDVLVLKESVCFSSSSREKGSVRTIGDLSDCSSLSKWGSFQLRSLVKHHRIKQRCDF